MKTVIHLQNRDIIFEDCDFEFGFHKENLRVYPVSDRTKTVGVFSFDNIAGASNQE